MERIFGKSNASPKADASEQWLSVSDLMSGLMMIFLFISVAQMRQSQIERDKVKDVAVTYRDSQSRLYQALQAEFVNELPRWNASIDQATLSVQFNSPDILFSLGSSELNPAFKTILGDFFPRYMKVLDQFKANVQEIRIEGHTSSQWNGGSSGQDAYARNMELSQARTRSVLFHVQGLTRDDAQRAWVMRHMAAVGLSSSRPVLTATGSEDLERSRRVTFRVITNAESQIRRILEQ